MSYLHVSRPAGTGNESSPTTHADQDFLPEALSSWNQIVYNELSDEPVASQDPSARLAANLELLSDLQSRFSFVMREITSLIRL